MSELNYQELIKESLSELEKLEREQKLSRFRDYVRYLRYLKEGTAKSQTASGSLIGLKARQSQNIWRTYKVHGLSYLLKEHRRGQVGQLSYVQISQLQSLLRDSKTALTQQQIAEWIATSFGVQYTQAGISVLFKRLKIKLKTGRPVNVRQKEGDIEDFKKKVPELTKNIEPTQIYCQDEMRYGTRTDAGRRWMPSAERPVCPVRIGYEFGLLYVAVCPYNGDLFAMFLPNMKTESFDIFVQSLIEHTQAKPTLFLDRATSHMAAKKDDTINFIFFPPACPELNPAERFFKELRKQLKCRVFNSLDHIQAKIEHLLQKYWDNPQLLINITKFPYFDTQ